MERGWADGVLKADRVLRAAETLHENEEDAKKQERIQRQIDAMGKARAVRRKVKGKRRPARANGAAVTAPPPPPAKVQKSSKKTTEEETTESQG